MRLNVITYPSALQFWLEASHKKNFEMFTYNLRNEVVIPDLFESNLDESYSLEIAKMYSLDLPVSYMVCKHSDRRDRKNCKCIASSKVLPQESFIKLSDDVYIASPEYCFLMASKSLSFPKLVELANNLCAMYVKIRGVEYSQISRTPLISCNNLKEYVEKAFGYKGRKFAERVLKYSVDNSNSPMESKLAAIACIPLMEGGYGIKKPEMNLHIFYGGAAAEYMKRNNCCCDMVWKDEKVVAEYDSNEFHNNPEQFAYDKRRITALQQAGYKVISITSESLRSADAFDSTFMLIKKSLDGRSIDKNLKKYRLKRIDVIKELFRSR